MRSTYIFRLRKILLAILLGLMVTLFYAEFYSAFLVHRAREYLVKLLGEEFRQQAFIGSIEGGILRKFILNDFQLCRKDSKGECKTVISVKQARINYRIWNFFMKGKAFPGKIRLIIPRIFLSGLKAAELNTGGNASADDFYLPKQAVLVLERGSVLLDESTPLIEGLDGHFKITSDGIRFSGVNCFTAGIPFTAQGEIFNAGGFPKFDLQFDSQVLDSFFNINGTVDNFVVWGIADLFKRGKIYILGDGSLTRRELLINEINFGNQLKVSGKIDFAEQKIALNAAVANGQIKLEVDQLTNSSTRTKAELRDVQIGNYKISSDVELVKAAPRYKKFAPQLEGSIFTANTTINGKPFKTLSGEFALYRDYLEIKSLQLENNYYLSGRVGLVEPYNLDLEITIKDADVGDLLVLGKTDNKTPLIGGVMQGWLKFQGPVYQLKTLARIEGEKGFIGGIKYERAFLDIEGVGPVLRVVKGRAIKREGYLEISGFFDFNRIGLDTMLKDIKITSHEKTAEFNPSLIHEDCFKVGREPRSLDRGDSTDWEMINDIAAKGVEWGQNRIKTSNIAEVKDDVFSPR